MDKDSLISLISEWKRKKIGDPKAIIHHLPQADQCPASVQAVAASLTNTLQVHPFWLLSRRLHGWNIPLLSLGQPFQLCLLPSSCPPRPTCRGAVWWRREGLDAAQVLLSSSQTTGVLSVLVLSQIQNASPCLLPWRKLNPSHPDPVQGRARKTSANNHGQI